MHANASFTVMLRARAGVQVVARMPYFSYISMLHLYESLGWWRAGAELRRVSTYRLDLGCLQGLQCLSGERCRMCLRCHARVAGCWQS